MKKIDIVLPVYNEEKGLLLFDKEIRKILQTLEKDYIFKLIYVVDRCPDKSFDLVREIVAANSNTVGIRLSNRFGHQNSLKAGLDYSQGDAVIMMDTDLEHPPALISQMLEKYKEGYDIVYTERTYTENLSVVKKSMSKLFYKFINVLSTVPIHESAADFRLISNKVVAVIRDNINEHTLFLRGIFPWMGFDNTTLSYTSGFRTAGVSKYNLSRLVHLALDGIISFSNKPLYISIFLGVFIAIVSCFYAVYLIVGSLIGSSSPQGWLTTMVAIFFMGSLQLITIGVIGLYVGKIFEETKNRPNYIIDEIVRNQKEGVLR